MFQVTKFNRLLVFFFLFIGFLILARIVYTGTYRYLFLVWNLFLAWLPYAISGRFKHCMHAPRYMQYILLIAWLMLFPNALYIITDFIHLQIETNMPVWYDAILLFASSFLGLVLAFLSIQKAENVLAKMYPSKSLRLFAPIVLSLGAFGVFLGRFLRWNSWDVINNPAGLFQDIFSILFFPHHNVSTWLITGLLSSMYCLMYFFLKHLQSALGERRER